MTDLTWSVVKHNTNVGAQSKHKVLEKQYYTLINKITQHNGNRTYTYTTERPLDTWKNTISKNTTKKYEK